MSTSQSVTEPKDVDLRDLIVAMVDPETGVSIRDRKYRLRTYKTCFVGSDTTKWLMKYMNCGQAVAVAVGQRLIDNGYIRHVVDLEKPFLAEKLFYRFDQSALRSTARRSTSGLLEKLPASEVLTIPDLVALMRRRGGAGVSVRNRTYHLRTYKNCMICRDVLSWMMIHLPVRSRSQALTICNKMVDEKYIEHVCDAQAFADEYLFFRWTEKAIGETRLDGARSSTPTRTSRTMDSESDYSDGDTSDVGNSDTETDNDTTITVNSFDVIKSLGAGGYAKVLLCQKRGSDRQYAMKVVSKRTIKKVKDVNAILTERQVLANDNPFLVQLHYAFQCPKNFYFVMDFMAGGDLFHHLQRNPNGFPLAMVVYVAAEIALGLAHLHRAGVIYRDLKLENVLLDTDGHVCLTDFGLSKVLEEDDDRTHTMCGTPSYLAPEILRGKAYGRAIDYWALGILIYEMLSCTNPFATNDVHSTCVNILRLKVQYSEKFNAHSRKLIDALLQRDPTLRLSSLQKLKDQPFFRTIEWMDLAVKKQVPPYQITPQHDSKPDDSLANGVAELILGFDDEDTCHAEDSDDSSAEKASPRAGEDRDETAAADDLVALAMVEKLNEFEYKQESIILP
eukprot:TRINITY_DN5192_c0_g2_i1.p1 TRINITY_DN5192_c0_g2~~TRINITY_DN5192_c0_g2_i1.p1  ORF type:complete len:619 (-),score=131.39 TRINITY_DN5192_c0_g2_i1:80-1936(-)